MFHDPHDPRRKRREEESRRTPKMPLKAYRVYRHDPAGDVFLNRKRPLYSETAAIATAKAETLRTGRRTSVVCVPTVSFLRLTAPQKHVWMSHLHAPRAD